MPQPVVAFGTDNKSVHIIAVNGARTTVVAQKSLSVWFRKDGGVTVRADAEHSSQTIRVDTYGRVFSKSSRGRFLKV